MGTPKGKSRRSTHTLSHPRGRDDTTAGRASVPATASLVLQLWVFHLRVCQPDSCERAARAGSLRLVLSPDLSNRITNAVPAGAGTCGPFSFSGMPPSLPWLWKADSGSAEAAGAQESASSQKGVLGRATAVFSVGLVKAPQSLQAPH